MGVLLGCRPRDEVLKGDLEDAIFAAEFGYVLDGSAPAVYSDAPTFFANTHPARQLCEVVQKIFGRLANPQEPGAAVRLSTGFGGGKTHTLISLYHLALHVQDPGLGHELLPAAGRPSHVAVAAIDAGKVGSDVIGRHPDAVTRSLWGEIAWQLGGAAAWARLGDTDHPERQPDDELLASLFPDGPVLILLDELVIYMGILSAQGQGCLLAFLSKLTSIVARRPQTVLVVTDPSDQRVYAQESERVGQAVSAAMKRDQASAALVLDDLLSRKVADFDPIGHEAAQVIVRRLFDYVDPGNRQAASAAYHSLYERVLADEPRCLPAAAASPDYAQRIVQCYPFHPRLLDTAQDRLYALQDFQKSRGVLRLFGRLIRDVWEAGEDLSLISAGDIRWPSPRIQADLLSRLNKDSFKAAITADVERHAADLDGGSRGIHQRVASALLLESLPLQPNSGLDAQELALATLRPGDAGPEPAEALDRLVGLCWHTYPMPGGRGWQFRYEPNVNRLIEERAADVSLEDAKSLVRSHAQGYFGGSSLFTLRAWPAGPQSVPETADLQLALCDSEAIAQSVCDQSPDSEPGAPLPRRFQNAIVAVAPTPALFGAAVEAARRVTAGQAIGREQAAGESGKRVKDQLSRILPGLERQLKLQTRRAFNRVALAGGTGGALEEKHLGTDDEILAYAKGQTCLRDFLKEKGLLYDSDSGLDPQRFVQSVLPGATPGPEPGVYTAKAAHERLLAAPGLRLIPGNSVVQETIRKAVAEGEMVVRLPDGRAYDSQGCVEGPAGARRRVEGKLGEFRLDDSVTLALAGAPTAQTWTREDGEDEEFTVPPPPPPNDPVASTWADAANKAQDRPLQELRLTACSPRDAEALIALAQPLGALRLALDVSVGGELKDGGKMSFLAEDTRPAHPARPLAMAQAIFSALAGTDGYEAMLSLQFGGRRGMAGPLRLAGESAPPDVAVRATFGEPEAGA